MYTFNASCALQNSIWKPDGMPHSPGTLLNYHSSAGVQVALSKIIDSSNSAIPVNDVMCFGIGLSEEV